MLATKETLLPGTCALPRNEATVAVNDVELFYRIGGRGPHLLLIHGFSRTGHMWDPFLGQLGEHYTVIVPDLPGCGHSTSHPGQFSHRQTARDMFALLVELGVDRIRGTGHSSGAVTLIHMATQDLDRVEAMVLVGGAHRCPTEAREVIRALHLEDLPQKHQDYLWRFHPGGEPQIPAILAQFRGQADNYEDFDLSPEHLATIATRTLLVWGDRDPFSRWNSRLRCIKRFRTLRSGWCPAKGTWRYGSRRRRRRCFPVSSTGSSGRVKGSPHPRAHTRPALCGWGRLR